MKVTLPKVNIKTSANRAMRLVPAVMITPFLLGGAVKPNNQILFTQKSDIFIHQKDGTIHVIKAQKKDSIYQIKKILAKNIKR